MRASDSLVWALDPVIFAREALNFRPDPWQQKVLRSSSRKLILNVTRQGGKSSIIAILSLHRALFFSGSLILLLSPSLRQSSLLFRKVVEFMSRLEDRPVLTERNRLSMQFASGSRIVSLPSTEGTVRGFSSVALIVVDEAAQVNDQLFKSISPMLAVSGGRLVLMSTPFGERGFFWETYATGGPTWERIEMKASDCPRISKEFLAEERASLGENWYAQEYECKFVSTINQVFSREMVMAAMSADVKPLFLEAMKCR
jgi:hypothetical protein